MAEKQQRPHKKNEDDTGGGFDSSDSPLGMVTVTHGLHQEQLPIAGMTVKDIRTKLTDRLDIDPDGRAQLDGENVDDKTVVKTGQNLMFVHRAGEKGS